MNPESSPSPTMLDLPDSDSQSPPHPSEPTPAATDDEAPPAPAPTSPSLRVPEIPSRKGKLRKPLSEKQRAAAAQTLSHLRLHLRLLPFSPPATASFAEKHEPLIRALGLYEFSRLDLAASAADLRTDLLLDLVAFYDPRLHRGFVRGGAVRVAVSRTDLARALSLPSKPSKSPSDDSATASPSPGDAAAILEFLSRYVLLQFHGDDDACILPPEVAAAEQMVRDGLAHKVDWAGLLWGLIEKEILEAPRKNGAACYYASHLQHLIKFQRPELFQEAAAEASPVPEMEASIDVDMEEEEEDDDEDEIGDGDGDVKVKSLEDLGDDAVAAVEKEKEKEATGLSLGIGAMDSDANADTVGDGGGNGDDDGAFEQCKDGDDVNWRIGDDKNDEGMPRCLQHCNSSGFGGMEFENLNKGDVEMRDEVRFDDGFSEKMGSLERLTSTDLLQAMNTMPGPYSTVDNAHDPSSGEFLTMGADAHKNMGASELGAGGSFFFGNNGKRQIGNMDDDYSGSAQQPFSQNNHPKRMRSCSSSALTFGSPEFNASILEPIHSTLAKATVFYAEKEQALHNALMEKEYLSGLVQQKDQIIQSLENARLEQHHKWQMELGRFEHELNVMAQLVVGYKKALKQSRALFSEYRKKFPQGDKPLYSDVPGSGGLVVSVKELERRRIEEQQQMLAVVNEMIEKFQMEWFSKLDVYEGALAFLQSRKDKLIQEMDLIKERRSAKVTTPAATEE